MAGSAAEERIRGKAEAALRRARPHARIVHELVLRQGGERIDLAAVDVDDMILVEIKSEKDTLSRLQAQLRVASGIGCQVWLCLAEKWRPMVTAMGSMAADYETVPIIHRGVQIGETQKHIPNPGHVPELRHAIVRFEVEDGFEPIKYGFRPGYGMDSRALLQMLWRDELQDIVGAGGRTTRDTCIGHALEELNGKAIRRGVLAALRARTFPRADPAVKA